eukprot:352949-Chlamydomonas_euryale.AAC.3
MHGCITCDCCALAGRRRPCGHDCCVFASTCGRATLAVAHWAWKLTRWAQRLPPSNPRRGLTCMSRRISKKRAERFECVACRQTVDSAWFWPVEPLT